MKKTKPFLKWPGNKTRCIEKILAVMPKANRLIEPFTGSGAIFVNSTYSHYLLAEKNSDLIALFTFLKQEGDKFISYCASFFQSQYNSEKTYYKFREEFNLEQNLRKKAALFLYLNRHGYNGLCRYNKQGFYNVPFGRYRKPYFPQQEMIYFYLKSQQAQFLAQDFRHTFTLAQPGDIIYCDPPYIPLTKSANFNAYVNPHFKEQDQIDLAQLARRTAEAGIPVIISNHDTEWTRFHYKESQIISFNVQRSISCHANRRESVGEILALFK